MRITDDRYAGERQQFDLAMRLIGHEARTHIITRCTGFSQDRVRKLYTTYFRNGARRESRRQRGKSPSNAGFFVKNARIQSEASTLALLFGLFGLIRVSDHLDPRPALAPCSVEFGERFCQAYETYASLHPGPGISFEHAWCLFCGLTERRDMVLADCLRCGNIYVQDALALDPAECPPCRMRRQG